MNILGTKGYLRDMHGASLGFGSRDSAVAENVLARNLNASCSRNNHLVVRECARWWKKRKCGQPAFLCRTRCRKAGLCPPYMQVVPMARPLRLAHGNACLASLLPCLSTRWHQAATTQHAHVCVLQSHVSVHLLSNVGQAQYQNILCGIHQ